MNTWAQKIIDLEGFGWRQSAIAEQIGLAQSTVSDIKHGRTKEPGGTAAVKLHTLHESERAKAQPASTSARRKVA